MKVSMDGLRNQLLGSYNRITRKLNNKIAKNEGEIRIRPEEIQNDMELLRSCIVTLAYMYDDSEGGFEIMKDPYFEEFNPIEEEEK